MVLLVILLLSYLKTLLDPFNDMVNKFLDQIKPLADGTTVPMKRHFGEFTLSVISKVSGSQLWQANELTLNLNSHQHHIGCIWNGVN